MKNRIFAIKAFAFALLLAFSTLPALAQSGGKLKGTVTLSDSGKPIHNVLVTILQLRRTVNTDESGDYMFDDVPPGRYSVLAHLDRVPDAVQNVTIAA